MEIWDITLRLENGSTTWPGEGRDLRQRWIATKASGAAANTSAFEGSVHLGTHVDAPLHFVSNAASVADLALERFIGAAQVVEVICEGQITPDLLRQSLEGEWPKRLLLKTRNSSPGGALGAETFDEDYCAVTAEAAALMVENGVSLVGIDAYSVAPFVDLKPTHEVLLKSGMPILEGLDLRDVDGGDYTLIAFPLRLVGFEASPVRAVLVREG